MPTSTDGILEATFDTAQNLVRLTVDGGMWPSPVDRLTITRASAGEVTEPVRTANSVPAAGGWWLGSDEAAPMDTTVTYVVTGTSGGFLVGTATVAVDTTGATWGPWLKAPGRPQLTCQVQLVSVGDTSSQTQGAAYQIPGGGGSIPQYSGSNTDSLSVVLLPRSDADVLRLTTLLRTERTLLIQTGNPGEPLLPSGYYFVGDMSRANPAQVRTDVFGRRFFTLELTATSAPAGEGQGFTGTTYETVRQTYATYQDLLDGNPTYFDVQQGV